VEGGWPRPASRSVWGEGAHRHLPSQAVAFAQARRFPEALRRAGVPSPLVVVRNATRPAFAVRFGGR